MIRFTLISSPEITLIKSNVALNLLKVTRVSLAKVSIPTIVSSSISALIFGKFLIKDKFISANSTFAFKLLLASS